MSFLDILKLTTGIVFLVIGLAFLYQPNIIIRINSIIREFIANDKRVILYHKKIAIFFISLSLIALYMGGSKILSTTQTQTGTGGTSKFTAAYQKLCAEAIEDYYEGRLKESLKKTLRALAIKPDEEWALTHLATIYDELGEKEKAKHIYSKILSLYPHNKTARANLIPTAKPEK